MSSGAVVIGALRVVNIYLILSAIHNCSRQYFEIFFIIFLREDKAKNFL